ncbi:hypothetical protein L1987_58547 [Smallanthus sonchifolius]|uniref:Uncharacterized protein n=1 Tax=Smallanthus sonchifolius TaxID=185202 RepID=A0ACB9DG76_9ASTR|nr:hypothetical protein L1987_58547 [Smallanthus sonchifolius]
MLMNNYNSHDHLKYSKKIAKRNKLDEMFASSSRLDDTCQSEVDLTSSSLEIPSLNGENCCGASLSKEQTCKQLDDRGWWCHRPVAEGKGYCDTHPTSHTPAEAAAGTGPLMFERTKRAPIVPKSEQNSDDGVTEVAVGRNRRKVKEESEGVSDVPRKRVRKIKKEDSGEGRSVVNLNFGRMEIALGSCSSSLQRKAGESKGVEFYGWSDWSSDIGCSVKAGFTERVIYDLEEDMIFCDPEKEMTVSNSEKKSDFEKSQQLHMIRKLLPVMKKMNEEKMMELNTEAKNKGICHQGLHVHIEEYTRKKECSCPPKNLGGCERDLLWLTSFYPFSLTKDLEESAKKLLCNVQLKNLNGLSDSSSHLLCDENGEAGLYFSTQPVFQDNNFEHFMKHWGKGQLVVIRDVLQNQPDLNWDFGFKLCTYLKKSVESRHNTGTRSAKTPVTGVTLNSKENRNFQGSFEIPSPNGGNCGGASLPNEQTCKRSDGRGWRWPVAEGKGYCDTHPTSPTPAETVAVRRSKRKVKEESEGVSDVPWKRVRKIKKEDPSEGRSVVVNLKFGRMKIAPGSFNTKQHLPNISENIKAAEKKKTTGTGGTSSRLKDTRNHEVVSVSDDSESESESESDDEDSSQVTNRCGAHWDIFRREDVPMLLEYLKKYSDKLSRSHGSSRKIVHPLFDEVFYLDDYQQVGFKF